MPKPILVNHAPSPADPVKASRDRLDALRMFPQLVQQQIILLDAEATRIDAELQTLTQRGAVVRAEREHLAGYLAVSKEDPTPREA